MLITTLLFILTIASKETFAQQVDGNARNLEAEYIKNQQRIYYVKNLSVNQEVAEDIIAIQETFKAGVKHVMAESGSEALKREKIDELIAEKLKKLKILLNPIQLEKIVPTTERNRTDILLKAKKVG